jgi:hypothetical protein
LLKVVECWKMSSSWIKSECSERKEVGFAWLGQ